jgi:MoaD family protein
MLEIKISFLSLLEDLTGIEKTTILVDDTSTVKDVLKQLVEQFGKKFENIILTSPNILSKYIILSLNGKDIRSSKYLDTYLHEGDEITFLPAIAGG